MTPRHFGLIGAGRWGQVYLRTIRDLATRCRVSHLCTRHPDHLAGLPDGVTLLADWRRLISSDCDAVIIAAPPQLHAEMVDACLAAGKPCIVEKPWCMDLPTAERLHQKAEAAGVPVLVDHTYLFSAAYEALALAMRQARAPIQFMCFEGLNPLTAQRDVSALWEWGPHGVSVCLDLLGELPSEVDGVEGHGHAAGKAAQVGLRLDFPSSAGAWIHAGWLPSQKRRTCSVAATDRLYLWDDLAVPPLAVSESVGQSPSSRAIPLADSTPPMTRMITYFLDGLAGGDRSRFGTGAPLEVTRVLARAESAIQARQAEACRGRDGVS